MSDKFYEYYWGNKVGYSPDFKIKWPKLKKFLPSDKNVTIVDFGCGNGLVLKEMKSLNSNARYISLDVSQAALSQAKNNFPDGIFYKITDGGKIPLDDKSVDFVFSSEVIEHIYDIQNAISEIARILKPGGRLLLTTPYHGLIKNILITFFFFNRHFDPLGSHIRFFTKKSLFNLLKNNSFNILKCGYYGRFYPLSHSIYVLAEKI